MVSLSLRRSDLKRRNGVKAMRVDEILCDIFQSDSTLRVGQLGPKDEPQTKEQADYNLKYLIAVALLDDQVGPST